MHLNDDPVPIILRVLRFATSDEVWNTTMRHFLIRLTRTSPAFAQITVDLTRTSLFRDRAYLLLTRGHWHHMNQS